MNFNPTQPGLDDNGGRSDSRFRSLAETQGQGGSIDSGEAIRFEKKSVAVRKGTAGAKKGSFKEILKGSPSKRLEIEIPPDEYKNEYSTQELSNYNSDLKETFQHH